MSTPRKSSRLTVEEIDYASLNLPRLWITSSIGMVFPKLATHPLSRIKTLQQVYHQSAAQQQFGVKSCWKQIYRKTGLRGLYKGLSLHVFGPTIAQGIYINSVEFTKSKLRSYFVADPGVLQANRALREMAVDAVAGACASCSSALLGVPVDVVLQRIMVQDLPDIVAKKTGTASMSSKNVAMQAHVPKAVQSVHLFKYESSLDAFRSILATEGVAGLYRGLGLQMFGNITTSMVWWSLYRQSRRLVYGTGIPTYLFPDLKVELGNSTGAGHSVEPRSSERKEGRKSVLTGVILPQALFNSVSGAVTGTTTALITQPVDVVKTRLQTLQAEDAVAGGHKMTTWNVFKQLWREEGIRFVMRGAVARAGIMGVSSSFIGAFYELAKKVSVYGWDWALQEQE